MIRMIRNQQTDYIGVFKILVIWEQLSYIMNYLGMSDFPFL
jgi:hypothetical protein